MATVDSITPELTEDEWALIRAALQSTIASERAGSKGTSSARRNRHRYRRVLEKIGGPKIHLSVVKENPDDL